MLLTRRSCLIGATSLVALPARAQLGVGGNSCWSGVWLTTQGPLGGMNGSLSSQFGTFFNGVVPDGSVSITLSDGNLNGVFYVQSEAGGPGTGTLTFAPTVSPYLWAYLPQNHTPPYTAIISISNNGGYGNAPSSLGYRVG